MISYLEKSCNGLHLKNKALVLLFQYLQYLDREKVKCLNLKGQISYTVQQKASKEISQDGNSALKV